MSRFRISIVVMALMATVVSGCSTGAVRHSSGVVVAEDTGIQAKAVPERVELEPFNLHSYQFYVDGLLYESLGDIQNAARCFQSALNYHPESLELCLAYTRSLVRLRQPTLALETLQPFNQRNAELYSIRASCYQMVGDGQLAKEQYLELIKIDSLDANAYLSLASHYHQIRNIDSTIWAYGQLDRIRPGNHELLNEMGRLQAASGDLASAKDTFRKSLNSVSAVNNMQALLGLAELHELTQDVDSLEATIQVGIESAPDDLSLRQTMIRICFQQDSVAKAVPHVRRIAELMPGDNDASRRLAALYFSLDSMQQADSILTRLVNTGEREATNHYYLGRIAALGNDFERARDEFILLTQLADTAFGSWMDLAITYRNLNDDASEIATYREGVDHMPNEVSAVNMLFSLGAAYERIGEIDSAVVVFEDILKHDPNHDQTLNYLGYTLAEHGIRLEYARDLISRAIQAQPKNPAYLDSFGWVNFQLGNFEEAVVYLESAAALDNDPVILDHLGDAYHAAGRHDEARVYWEKVLELQPDNQTIREKLDH